MSFDIIAKNLVNQRQNPTSENLVPDKADILQKLQDAGFGHDAVFTDLRNLYDNAEDDTTKKGILDMIVKMYGLYVNKEEKAAAPVININIKGDNNRLFRMLCPEVQEVAA